MGRHSRSLSQTGEMYEDSVLELNSEGVFGALGVASEQLGVFSRFVTSIVSDESNLGLQIYMCAKKGDEKKLSKLVADAKKNDLRYRREPLRDTALHRACDGGNTVCAYILLFAGAKINAKNDNGETPLHLAVRSNHINTVKFLIQHGADPNIGCTEKGYTPLHLMARNGSRQLFTAFVDICHDKHALPVTVCGKEVEIIDFYPDAKNFDGQTALHLCSVDRGAFRKNNTFIAEKLIELGSDPNAMDKFGDTPLHSASYYGAWEIANVLVENGASKLQKNFNGKQPHELSMQGISLAVHLGSVEQRLLKAKMDMLLTPMRSSATGIPNEGRESLTHCTTIKTTPPTTPSLAPKKVHRRRVSVGSYGGINPRRELEDQWKAEAKERRAQYLESEKVAIASQMALKVILKHPAAQKRKHVFLSFERNCTVADARANVLKYLNLKDDDDVYDYSLYIPRLNERTSDRIMIAEELISTYKLQEKDEIIFQDSTSVSTAAEKIQSDSNPILRQLKTNVPKKRRYSSLRIPKKKQENTNIDIIVRGIKSANPDVVMEIPEKNTGPLISPSITRKTETKKRLRESQVMKIVEKEVLDATIPLKNEIARLRNRMNIMMNKRDAQVEFPLNSDGLNPGDSMLWIPANLKQLYSMSSNDEKQSTSLSNSHNEEEKKMWKLKRKDRLRDLLKFYNLPPFDLHYCFQDALETLVNFIVYEE